DPDEQSRRALQRMKEIFGLTPDCAPPGYGAPPQSSQPGESPQGAQPGVAPAAACPSPSADQAGKVGALQPEEKDERYPRITAAEWEARERPRQLLENILTRQVEICEAQRQAILKESLAGPSPFERAAEIALAHPDAALMQRMEESSCRQIWRITNLLLKIKRQACEEESREIAPRTRDVYERKAG